MNEVKERIVNEAATLFRSYGIRAVTMDMLASSLGMSKRTIYENFNDKSELLIGVVRYMEMKRVELVQKTLHDSPDVIHAIFTLLKHTGDHFRSMNPAFFDDLKRHQTVLEANGLCGIPDLTGSLAIVEKGKKDGVFRPEIGTELTNRAMYGVFTLAANYELFPAPDFTREEIIKGVYISYLRGIATPAGAELIECYTNVFELRF